MVLVGNKLLEKDASPNDQLGFFGTWKHGLIEGQWISMICNSGINFYTPASILIKFDSPNWMGLYSFLLENLLSSVSYANFCGNVSQV